MPISRWNCLAFRRAIAGLLIALAALAAYVIGVDGAARTTDRPGHRSYHAVRTRLARFNRRTVTPSAGALLPLIAAAISLTTIAATETHASLVRRQRRSIRTGVLIVDVHASVSAALVSTAPIVAHAASRTGRCEGSNPAPPGTASTRSRAPAPAPPARTTRTPRCRAPAPACRACRTTSSTCCGCSTATNGFGDCSLCAASVSSSPSRLAGFAAHIRARNPDAISIAIASTFSSRVQDVEQPRQRPRRPAEADRPAHVERVLVAAADDVEERLQLLVRRVRQPRHLQPGAHERVRDHHRLPARHRHQPHAAAGRRLRVQQRLHDVDRVLEAVRLDRARLPHDRAEHRLRRRQRSRVRRRRPRARVRHAALPHHDRLHRRRAPQRLARTAARPSRPRCTSR